MPGPLTVRCPACEASLKLKNRQFIGRKVACPKCRRPFVVEDPADADDDFSALDEFDSFEDTSREDDEAYEPPAPRTAGRASRPGRSAARGSGRSSDRPSSAGRRSAGKRKSSRRSQNKLPLIIGGSLLGLALLVGLAFTVSGLLRGGGGGGSAGQVSALSYLPPDSEVVFTIRIGDLFNSPWKEYLVRPEQQQALNMAKVQLGIDPMQVDTLSVAVSGLKFDAQTLGSGAASNFNPMLNSNIQFMVLLRSREDLPLDRIRRGSRTVTHNGATFYANNGPLPMAAHLPDSRTLLLARESEMRAAIDRGPQPPTFEQFAFADLNQHVSIAFAPRDRSFLKSLEVPEVPGMPAVSKLAQAAKTATGFGLDVNYGADTVTTQLRVRCGSPRDAEQMAAALKELLEQGRPMLDMFKGMADAQTAQGLDVAAQLLAGLTVSPSADTVVARVGLTRENALRLQQLGSLQTAFDGPGAGVPTQDVAVPPTRPADTSNLTQIGLALHNYHDQFGHFPPGGMSGSQGTPLLSWRVALLPYLGEQALYDQFRHDEPWDSQHNRALIPRMPQAYARPEGGSSVGTTPYLAVAGPGTVFEGARPSGLRDIADGTSNTVAVVEVDDAHAVEWTRPQDFEVNPAQPLAGLHQRPGGFQMLFCDGRVQLLANVSREMFLAFASRSGGEAVSP